MADGQLILVAGALLAAGLLASLLATRLRVPSLALFLGVGMLVGTDGLGWIDFSDYKLERTIGIIALALILMLYRRRGSLDVSLWQELREPGQEATVDEEPLPSPPREEPLPTLSPSGVEPPQREETSHV